ncbi:N5-glutamine S-adenosyl-L-methionine-dependent methyltransferase [Brevibacillus reuszeri]|uniref:putative protein N(5)-glutamine methyltransferase n=1 Tax=Brevibacillus reuszeri TaxID=54915 RepID=UPI001B2D86BB|nr:putative protein N(5)-glutamine methyltransferase [Brevibacillus reuszeri]GIO09480.1 N5-glutamine S-adenosyl-L-methionine-dependent methyltransferase [Brevibacillus reuszeri]
MIADKLRAAGCVFAEDEAKILISSARTTAELNDMVNKRITGLPLEHILGWVEFCGLKIAVDTGVFIPRRRTELLVRHAISLVRSGSVVVDLCCGSGVLGAVIAANVELIELHAVDIDPVAVSCAHKNITGTNGHVYEGDLYEPLPSTLRNRVDILIANVPYVPTESIRLLPPEARIYEAHVALHGGEDGLDVMRRVATDATLWLVPGGQLFVETSERQAPLAVEIFAQSGLTPQVVTDQELDATIVIGTRTLSHLP